jgi:hypothetical protein
MSSVNSSVEIMLTKEEKELLEKAIAKIKEIYKDVIDANSSLFLDEEDIYSILANMTTQYNGKLPTVIDIDE